MTILISCFRRPGTSCGVGEVRPLIPYSIHGFLSGVRRCILDWLFGSKVSKSRDLFRDFTGHFYATQRQLGALSSFTNHCDSARGESNTYFSYDLASSSALQAHNVPQLV